MAYPILANAPDAQAGDVLRGSTHYEPDRRTVATVEFIESACIIPSAVDPGEVFNIKIVYRLVTIEERNYGGILDHFDPMYDGGYYIIDYSLGIPCMSFWIWQLSSLDFSVLKGATWQRVQRNPRSLLSPPQIFEWNFHGTIADLTGMTPPPGGSIIAKFILTGRNYGWYTPSDFWPYNWNPSQNFFYDCEGGAMLQKTITVNLIPTPPYPLFNLDLCSVSKESVAPNESFNIKVTIVNQNQYSGAYKIDCYCLGNKTTLGTGTIGGNATKTQTFSVTASQLANQEFTESQYIFPEIAVSNSDGETDRWPLAEIAVIVIPGGEMGTLSGRVTDKKTGLALSGVSISTVGKTVMTNSSGDYAFGELAIGPYSIKFSKAGYWDETKSKTIIAGENTLNLAMTLESEPPPDHGIPQELIVGLAAIGGTVAAVLIIAKKRVKGK